MSNKLFHSLIIFIFIVGIQSCTTQRKTIVNTPNVKKVIREKYLVRNDSVFFKKRLGRITCITILDSLNNNFVIQEFHNGKITGKKFIYESNGNLSYYGEYRKGRKDGWHFRFINGRIWISALYKDDIELSYGITDWFPEF